MLDDVMREAMAVSDRGPVDVEADLDATQRRARRLQVRRQHGVLAGAAVAVATVITATVAIAGSPGDVGVSTGPVASNGGTGTVSVTSATGAPAPVVVPDVVGLSEPHARIVLEAAGLGTDVQVAGEPPEGPSAYEVSAQDPPAGSAVATGYVVTLTVPAQHRDASDRSDWDEVEADVLHSAPSLPYEITLWAWADRDALWRALYQDVDRVTQGSPVAVADGVYRSRITVHVPPRAAMQISLLNAGGLAATPVAGPPSACAPGECPGQPTFHPHAP